MQTTSFYFLLSPLFFLVLGAPTPLLNVSQAIGWQENQLQIPIKEAQLFYKSVFGSDEAHDLHKPQHNQRFFQVIIPIP
jgi:hypothetical protein